MMFTQFERAAVLAAVLSLGGCASEMAGDAPGAVAPVGQSLLVLDAEGGRKVEFVEQGDTLVLFQSGPVTRPLPLAEKGLEHPTFRDAFAVLRPGESYPPVLLEAEARVAAAAAMNADDSADVAPVAAEAPAHLDASSGNVGVLRQALTMPCRAPNLVFAVCREWTGAGFFGEATSQVFVGSLRHMAGDQVTAVLFRSGSPVLVRTVSPGETATFTAESDRNVWGTMQRRTYRYEVMDADGDQFELALLWTNLYSD
jgi:hypothetical protein